MAPKGSADLKEKAILQAILIADSFNTRFQPLTNNRPRVLLPFINRPLIDYTLRYLELSGVQEVFVLSAAHSGMIRDHIRRHWSNQESAMKIQVNSSENYLSLGDMLRDVDQKGLIKSDFILIHGDVVANLPLQEVLEVHRHRRLHLDKGAVMTSILQECSIGHPSHSREDEIAVVTNSANKVLYYEKVGLGTPSALRRIEIPLHLLQSNDMLHVQRNLRISFISICSVQFLMLFSENVDYQNVHDFVRGVLVDEEIHGNTVYVHKCRQGYAARATNPKQYDAMSRDLLRRWIHPIIPDLIFEFHHRRGNIYLHKNHSLDLVHNTRMEENVIVGESTTIGRDVTIRDSVIGANCRIGSSVRLNGAYIWDNVTIEDGCELTQCIVANDVHLKRATKITKGCVIGENVILGPNITLPNCTLLQNELPEGTEAIKPDPKLVGSGGRGYRYTGFEDSDDEDQGQNELEIWGQPPKILEDRWSSSEDELESDDGGQGSVDEEEEDDFEVFYGEVIENFKSALANNVESENIILEINSVKHAYNVPIDQVNQLIVRALADLPKQLDKPPIEGSLVQQLRFLLGKFAPVLNNYIKSAESQKQCLEALEYYTHYQQQSADAGQQPFTASTLTALINYLYDKDEHPIDEDVILSWYHKPNKIAPILLDDLAIELDQMKELRKQPILVKFIEWLENAEEESDDD